jgi:phenylalanyl-tRNA synthetase beta chain
MNISYNWLKDYVRFDLSPNQLSDVLTSIGLETGNVEEVETIRGGLKGLIIGKVLTCENHLNSDHLHVTTVDLGLDAPRQIVCGAPNVAAGQKVIVAPVGTKLYSDDDSFILKKLKIRGVESNGMICAEDEIGMGNMHEGIIVLPDEAPIGMPVNEYYQIKSDYVLEVDITPNRIDAASHYGVARDLAAYLAENGEKRCTLSDLLSKPSVDDFKIDDFSPAVEVEVENTEACPRYSGLTIRNIQVKESPAWLKNRLETVGIRSINNVVDVTNYILNETGQPLHAFDLKAIQGQRVIVKTLPEGTPLTTLDGVERKLSGRDLAICNSKGGMCIGGVFGGLDSGVTETTTDVFLESACFHPTWIRKTARLHGLNTDASFHFERGTDPNNTLYVLKRAALLIKEVAGGSITGEIQDVYPVPIAPAEVELSLRKTRLLIGKQIPEDAIERILKSLEIEIVEKKDDVWKVSVPSYRIDVTRDVDVIEEILRIYGYNQVETNEEIKFNLSFKTSDDRIFELQNSISEQLTGAGLNEILNNSFSSGSYYEGSSAFPIKNCVRLQNPISADLSVMRQTLLFGGLASIDYNRNRKNSDLKFYEFGNTYMLIPERQKGNDYLSAIREEFKLALWLTGNLVSNSWIRPTEKTSVYELKSYVENILLRLGIAGKKKVYKPLANDIFSAALSVETFSGRQLGVLGILRKSICEKFDIPVEVYFAELNWQALMQENRNVQVKSTAISRFHPVRRDLALLLDKNISFAEIEKALWQTDKKLLKEVSLFDVYEGKNLPEGKKSYAIGLVLQDEEKTLIDNQIESLMSRIRRNLEEQLGAQLR